MPNTPIQQPNIALPGAEYFSLSPNRTIALQGRRRKPFTSTTVVVPAETDGVNISALTPLETGFTDTSGIYLHDFHVSLGVSAAGATLNNVIAGLNLLNTLSPDYQLGSPIITTLTFFISSTLLTDRDKLISAKDIHAADIAAGGVGQTQILSLAVLLNVNNPNPNPVNIFLFGTIIYSRLDGLVE